jgi:hypothetical protein
MALPDLTGQNIQDTYQRVLQIGAGGTVFDGTGSLPPVLQVTASHAISASHEITHEISSSHAQTADSASYVLASNIDQPFTNITASGDISASGNIIGGGLTFKDASIQFITQEDNKIEFDSSGHKYNALDSHTMHYNEAQNNVDIRMDSSEGVNLFSQGNAQKIGIGGTVDPTEALTVTGNISASGFVVGTAWRGNGRIYPGYNVSTSHFLGKTTSTNPILRAAGGFNVQGHVTASGNISASGDIIGITGSFNAVELSNNGKIFVGSSKTEITTNNDDYWIIKANGIQVADFKNSGAVFNEGGVAQADFRIESNLDTHLLFVDAGADKMAIGTGTVSDSLLTVDGERELNICIQQMMQLSQMNCH